MAFRSFGSSSQYLATDRRQMATGYLILSWVLLILLGWMALRKKPEGQPPGPRPLPLLGNLLQLGKLPHRTLAELARRHGPLMFLQLGLVPCVVVSSPALAKQVLHEHDQELAYRAPVDALRILDHEKLSMIQLPPGAAWRNIRRICASHILANQRLDASQGLRSRKMKELVSLLEKSARAGEAVDVGRATFTTMLNLLSTTIFSEDMAKYEELSSSEFKNHVRQLVVEAGTPNISDFFPMLRWLDPQGCRRKVAFHTTKLNDILERKVDDRQRARLSQSFSEPGDFLQVLLDAYAAQELDRPAIATLLRDIFVAGNDPSSGVIEWAMSELLRSPTAMEKVRREVAEAMEGLRKEVVEESDLSRMPFLQAVVKETLRLYTPSPLLFPRQASATVQLAVETEKENTSLYTVPAGTRIMVNAWAISRDPSTWGSDADLFRPERFAGGKSADVDYRGRHMELIPFGAGRRICPGMQLALRMIQLTLANLIWLFHWKLPEGSTPADISMAESFGLSLSKAEPLLLYPVIARKTVE